MTIHALPGPVAHLDAITAALDDGLTCLWLVPDTLVESGVADQLVDDLADRPNSVQVPPPKGDALAHRPVAESHKSLVGLATDEQPPPWARDVFGLLTDDPWPQSIPDLADSTPPTTPSPSLANRLAETLDEPAKSAGDPVRALVGSSELRGRVIVVRAWDELDPADVADLLVRLPAVVKELGVPPADRPRLLMATRLRDLPDGVLDLIDSVTTSVTWWWGAVGRLDTAVVVALERSRRARTTSVEHPVREQVIREVIAEVAGPDLTLAGNLATTWDGRLATLTAELPEHRTAAGHVVTANYRTTTARPPVQFRTVWARGLVELWDGQVRPNHAIIAPNERDDDLRAKIWRGQNRALTPFIDEHRARFENTLRSRASMAVLAELTRSDWRDRPDNQDTDSRRAALELGPMAWAVGTRRVRIPNANLLFCLRDIRNLLAHLRPLDDQDLDRLIRLLCNPT